MAVLTIPKQFHSFVGDLATLPVEYILCNLVHGNAQTLQLCRHWLLLVLPDLNTARLENGGRFQQASRLVVKTGTMQSTPSHSQRLRVAVHW